MILLRGVSRDARRKTVIHPCLSRLAVLSVQLGVLRKHLERRRTERRHASDSLRAFVKDTIGYRGDASGLMHKDLSAVDEPSQLRVAREVRRRAVATAL